MTDVQAPARDAATLVLAALDHLRAELPAMMAKPGIATVDGQRVNHIPRAALDYLANGILSDFEMPVDGTWWRDYLLITGHHMILTDYGWEPGSVKSDYDPEDIYDEVNAP